MAAYNKSAHVVLVVAVALLACMAIAEAAISCGTVSSKLAPCLTYLTGKAPAPTAGCCSGVQSLYAATKPSKPDRVTACGCIKQVASSVALQAGPVGSLPGKCGVSLGYTPSVSINCATIP